MPAPSLLSTKLERARSRSKAPNGRSWRPNSLSEAIEDRPDLTSVSETYIRNLESGKQTNPTLSVVEALASVLRVSPSYFLPSTPLEDLDYTTWRDTEDAEYILRLLIDMSPERRHNLIELAAHYRNMEGLPHVDFPARADRAGEPPSILRRMFARLKKGDELDPHEVAVRITESLQGQADQG